MKRHPDSHPHRQIAVALLLLALSGCGRDAADAADAVDATAASELADREFRTGHARWVAEREDGLREPDGWTSLIGLHWVETGVQTVGGGEGNAIRLSIAPDVLGRVEQRDGTLYFTAAPDASVTLDGQPLQGAAALRPQGPAGTPVLAYDAGRGQISVIRRGTRQALRVRHADAPALRNFNGLDFWPADPEWRVQARFVAHPPGRTLPIVNIIGDVNDNPNPGYVEFEKDGQVWRLEALGDPARGLNLMFQDRTSGRESYGVGRYLRTGPVAADGTLALDFNRAHNPPCAYTEYATCPLPPPENRLTRVDEDSGERVRLAVLAGEKTYVAASDRTTAQTNPGP